MKWVVDVGGTNTRVAQVDGTGRPRGLRIFPSREFPSLEAILRTYGGKAEAAAVAVAGPVIDGVCRVTNLPWEVSAAKLQRTFGWKKTVLVNDLAAHALGVASLPTKSLISLNGRRFQRTGRNAVVIAPGTGYGLAALLWDGERHRALATESGHVAFAADDDEAWEYRAAVCREHGVASVETVLAGHAFSGLFRFYGGKIPRGVREPNVWVGERAAAGNRRALKATRRYAALLYREAEDAALRYFALGGVIFVGNVARALGPHLGAAAGHRRERGPASIAALLEQVPIGWVDAPELALRGLRSELVGA